MVYICIHHEKIQHAKFVEMARLNDTHGATLMLEGIFH